MKKPFLEKIESSIRKHKIIIENDHVLVCVSGGPDSICMLYALNRLAEKFPFRLTVAHFNHMLRGEESGRDQEFVRNLAASLELPFAGGKGDVSAYQLKHGASREEAARILRYRFFENESKRLSVNKVALGHHALDQAETVLMRILRGTGTGGLSGILPIRGGQYIRPLLFFQKKEILDFLAENGTAFLTDSSNLKADTLRNKVRLELIPSLSEQYNPRVVESLVKIAELAREEDEFLRQYSEKLFFSITLQDPGNRLVLDRKALKNLAPAIQRRLIRMGVQRVKTNLKRLSFSHIENALELLESGAVGKRLNWPDGITIRFSYDTVTILRNEVKAIFPDEVFLPVPGEVIFRGKKIISEWANARDWENAGHDKHVAWMDGNNVSAPLPVRLRRPGDRFQPLGMGHEKKLKDFFIDRKVPLEERDAIPVFLSMGKIVWVGGVEISETVKITDETKKAVRISIRS